MPPALPQGKRTPSGLASSRTSASHGSRSNVRRMNPRNTRTGNQKQIEAPQSSPLATAGLHRCCMKRIRFGRMDSCDTAIGLDSCRKFRLPAESPRALCAQACRHLLRQFLESLVGIAMLFDVIHLLAKLCKWRLRLQACYVVGQDQKPRLHADRGQAGTICTCREVSVEEQRERRAMMAPLT